MKPLRYASLVCLAVMLFARAAAAQSYPAMADEHVTIAAIRISLWGWMTPLERARLDAVDTSHTRRGDARELTLMAADRVTHVVLPIALDAAHRTAEAIRLRTSPAVIDRATARSANAMVQSLPHLAATPPSMQGATTGPLGCDQPITWASIALQQAGDRRFADRADVSMAFCAAARVGGDRAALVDAAIGLVRDLATAARPAPNARVVAELVQPGPSVPHCGTVHFLVPMRYRVISVESASLTASETIDVIVSCPEMAGVRFVAGERHQIELAPRRPWSTGAMVRWPDHALLPHAWWALSFRRAR